MSLALGASEEWIIHPSGAIQGEATETMAVSKLVKKIAADQTIRAHSLRLAEQEVDLDLISKALKTGLFGSMPREHWEALASQQPIIQPVMQSATVGSPMALGSSSKQQNVSAEMQTASGNEPDLFALIEVS